MAGRWVLSQFSLLYGRFQSQFWYCVAVSTSRDALGAYNLYAFEHEGLPDYPKMGTWPDAYYSTFNVFDPGFVGARVCAYDRARMLAGEPATPEFQQCVQLPLDFRSFSLLPADLDGDSPPPRGSPNYLVSMPYVAQGSTLLLRKFFVDWSDAGGSRLTEPEELEVESYRPACITVSRTQCVPQPDTPQLLESLGNRLMFRFPYRVVNGEGRLVVVHAIEGPTGSAAVRWYELRIPPGRPPAVFQQGTYSPDDRWRWMPSAAMDRAGNVAVGYSLSGGSAFPSLAYSVHLASGPPDGALSDETLLVNGTGSQVWSARWGDYTHMSLDAVDDCVFWYTGQYQSSSEGLWRTRIASFRLPNCH